MASAHSELISLDCPRAGVVERGRGDAVHIYDVIKRSACMLVANAGSAPAKGGCDADARDASTSQRRVTDN